MLNQIPQGDRTTPAARGARASALLGLGWNLGNLGSHEEAIALLREAADLRDWISVQDPKNN